jgi:hypothetical protein
MLEWVTVGHLPVVLGVLTKNNPLEKKKEEAYARL